MIWLSSRFKEMATVRFVWQFHMQGKLRLCYCHLLNDMTVTIHLKNYKNKLLLWFTSVQFRALSDQFYRSPEHHKFVRQQVINQVRTLNVCFSCPCFSHRFLAELIHWWTLFINSQLKSNPEIYEGYVPMAYGDYLRKLSKYGYSLYIKHALLMRCCCYGNMYWISWFACFVVLHCRSGEWGDHVTLQAAADSVCFVFFPYKPTCSLEPFP